MEGAGVEGGVAGVDRRRLYWIVAVAFMVMVGMWGSVVMLLWRVERRLATLEVWLAQAKGGPGAAQTTGGSGGGGGGGGGGDGFGG